VTFIWSTGRSFASATDGLHLEKQERRTEGPLGVRVIRFILTIRTARLKSKAETEAGLKIVNRSQRIGVESIKEACAAEIDDGISGIDPKEGAWSWVIFHNTSHIDDKECLLIEAQIEVSTTEMHQPRPRFDEKPDAIKLPSSADAE
jgi:hypothetical protein